MKKLIKEILYALIDIRLFFIKIRAKIFGDYVINNYLKKCSERFIPHSLNNLGASTALNSNIKQGITLDNTYFNYNHLEIGDNCYIGRNVFFDLANKILIKREAVVSEGVSILTHQDVGNRMLKDYFKRKDGDVVLEEGCWIGAGAIILCGVRVGKCSVVGAGSVVTKDVPDFTVVGGVPAKTIKTIGKK